MYPHYQQLIEERFIGVFSFGTGLDGNQNEICLLICQLFDVGKLDTLLNTLNVNKINHYTYYQTEIYNQKNIIIFLTTE